MKRAREVIHNKKKNARVVSFFVAKKKSSSKFSDLKTKVMHGLFDLLRAVNAKNPTQDLFIFCKCYDSIFNDIGTQVLTREKPVSVVKKKRVETLV